VPDPEKSLEKGAVLPWRRGAKRMLVYYKALLRGMAQHYGQSLETPWKDLPEDFRQKIAARFRRGGNRIHLLARRQNQPRAKAL
jgi:excinuclease UvrABC ATPase subunit